MSRTGSETQLLDSLGSVIDPATLAGQQDWYFRVANGEISGFSRTAVGGQNPGLLANTEASVNQIRLDGVSEVYTYLTANTTLYASSSDNSDTQTIGIFGQKLDGSDIVNTFALATLNGQTPVALSTELFRMTQILSLSPTNPAGEVYVSTDNGDITNGVPNTLSNIKIQMVAGYGAGTHAAYLVPTGKKGYLVELTPNVSKASDIDFFFRITSAVGSSPRRQPPFQLFQNNSNFLTKSGFVLSEGQEIDFVISSPTAGSKASFSFTIIEYDA